MSFGEVRPFIFNAETRRRKDAKEMGSYRRDPVDSNEPRAKRIEKEAKFLSGEKGLFIFAAVLFIYSSFVAFIAPQQSAEDGIAKAFAGVLAAGTGLFMGVTVAVRVLGKKYLCSACGSRVGRSAERCSACKMRFL
jgi:hypothetical protein